MNIEDRLREIIREELAPMVALMQAAQRDQEPPRSAVEVAPTLLPQIEPQRWLTTDEAAGLLRLNPKTLANWRAQGRGAGLSSDSSSHPI